MYGPGPMVSPIQHAIANNQTKAALSIFLCILISYIKCLTSIITRIRPVFNLFHKPHRIATSWTFYHTLLLKNHFFFFSSIDFWSLSNTFCSCGGTDGGNLIIVGCFNISKYSFADGIEDFF